MSSKSQRSFPHFAIVVLCFLTPLALFFYPSFDPDLVLFSNDGPLGALVAQADKAHEAFTGYWQPLNWLGIQNPSALPNVTMMVFLLMGGPVIFAKFYTPLALLSLGFCAWFFFKQMGFHRSVCILAGIAAILNTNVFSNACWGLPIRALNLGVAFLALAALRSGLDRWLVPKTILAGWAVAMGIMEGFDVGALFSLYVAAFAFLIFFVQPGSPGQRLGKAVLAVSLVAIFSALFAAQALSTLIGTQIKGVAGMEQDEQSKEQRWTGATMWSLPKIESLRVIIPGLFGYRMDTPEGGQYWGAVGQSPGVKQSRHSGSGEYAGVLVILVGLFAVAQSFRKSGNPFTPFEKKMVWLWAALAAVALALAWGRHAPFYRLVYALPYFSTIRNPIKFMHLFQLCALILFGFGLEALFRGYLSSGHAKAKALFANWSLWWKSAGTFDKKFVYGVFIGVTVALLGSLVYFASSKELLRHLQESGFRPEDANAILKFSYKDVGVFLFFLVVSAAAFLACVSGFFSGGKVKWAFMALGLILTIDLVRANLPWVVYYDYKVKYATNPIIDFFREKPAENRVTAKFFPFSQSYLTGNDAQFFGGLCNEWLQHHFQYYRIQSLDIVQMPRIPALDESYIKAFQPTNDSQFHLLGRLWELSNTRYVLGQRDFLGYLNQKLDPIHQRFRILTNFNVAPKPGVRSAGGFRYEDLTAEFSPDGPFSIFEFTGALPRAKIYNNWRVFDKDGEALSHLATTGNPAEQVLIIATNASTLPSPAGTNVAGSARLISHEPKRIEIETECAAPAVLLLNDRYDPSWSVQVDGAAAELVRCNYIMRGVLLTPGAHKVTFSFRPPLTGLYLSLAAIALGLAAIAFLAVQNFRHGVVANQKPGF